MRAFCVSWTAHSHCRHLTDQQGSLVHNEKRTPTRPFEASTGSTIANIAQARFKSIWWASSIHMRTVVL